MAEEIRILGEISAKNFTTSNYKIFKRLPGNRLDIERRAKFIMKSIREDGYVPSVIIVNENMEIIDGQAREHCCEKFGLPVTYAILRGAGIETCRILNKTVSPWRLIDYVESGAEMGDVSYAYLRNLIRAYQPKLGLRVVFMAVVGTYYTPKKAIVDGTFSLTGPQYNEALSILEYLLGFAPAVSEAKGAKSLYYAALAFCMKQEEIDRKRLLDKVIEHRAQIVPIISIEQALDVIEKIYNIRIRGEKAYLTTAYKKHVDARRHRTEDDDD